MRTLKFRQWVNGRFHYWGFLKKNYFIGPINPSGPSQQFTGLSDRSGKEIYEGDICKQNNLIDIIQWNNGSYWYNWLEGSQIENSNIEIIGNIYENPELVKL